MKFRLLLLCLLLIFSFSTVLLINNKSAEEVDSISTDVTLYIQQYDKLIDEINQEIRKIGIGFVLDYAILPDENIEILIKLPSEKIKRSTKKEITQIVTRVLKESNSDPDLFRIHISSYYKTTKEHTSSSVRLSYNDLMGYIMQELEKQNYSTFSLEYKVASEKVELIINLPVDNDVAANSKAEQIATDIIKLHHFDKDDFQINITNGIHTASSAQNAEAHEIIKRIQETNFTVQLEEELKKNGYTPNGFTGIQIYSKDKQYITILLDNIDPKNEELNREIQIIVDRVSQENGLGLFIVDIQGI